ncbi:hypothetical protein ACHHYP_00805 [Achlya hypogyna]|uniref:Uncharacterized protein n=1 Tax=Achlya hypogyna TaxID=1202772 RepID=A0A1V9ZA95_ACHHY|nr:hypothetical protein ACHHYP_00805 [Achlya hypogyna]
MSFLERFGDKISTVTMHGTLKRSDGSEEVRSGPLRKKPQPPSALVPKAVASNNAVHEAKADGDSEEETTHSPPPQASPVKKKSSPKKTKSTKAPERPTPVDLNEQRVVTEQDQLAFSKKARPVQFEPCTLSEYKQEKHTGYYELGKLKPDLNADDLVEKRANKERIKEFSKNLRAINQTLKKKEVVEVTPEKTLSTRDKALAFAKDKVPKPKVVAKKMPSPTPKPIKHVARQQAPPVVEATRTIESELQQLQMKHRAARAHIEALMRDSS